MRYKFFIPFALIGIFLCLLSALWAYLQIGFINESDSTIGYVTNFKYKYSRSINQGYYHYHRHRLMYYPIVTFTDKKDQKRIFTSSLGSSPSPYDIGQQVKVLYNDSTAKISDFRTLWSGIIFIAFMGTIFSAIGFYLPYFLAKHSENYRMNLLNNKRHKRKHKYKILRKNKRK
ncbi:DUF3592 domain-containing protein [Gilliamella apicola]|uniref:DUF3592 domain-containing protein n=1 Tax=Gilliamella apicola TaxID=1196095 RepID=UPI002FEE12F6